MNCPVINTNEGLIDRIIRVFIGVLGIVLANYWLWGLPRIIVFIIGIVSMATGVLGFCGLYTLFKINTTKSSRMDSNKLLNLYLVILAVVLYGILSVVSISITKKRFLEEYSQVNGYYKQALFLTGQNKRKEAKIQYDSLVSSYASFNSKYSSYKPYVISKDANFNQNLNEISNVVAASKEYVYNGDLSIAHKQLEEIRPIFQGILKRNGFSDLATNLVDFHDIMEKLIEGADAKDTDKILEVYTQADQALKLVEEEENSADVRAIRTKLEELKILATNKALDKLSGKAQELKTSFVKVYLIKG